MQYSTRSGLTARKLLGSLLLTATAAAVLYLPVRRELLDQGWIPSGRFKCREGVCLTLYANGDYVQIRNGQTAHGHFTVERFADIPRLSRLRLDSGELLHIAYDARAYRLDQVSRLSSAETTYERK